MNPFLSNPYKLPDTRTSTDKSCSRRVLGTPYREDIPVPRHRWGWVQTSLHWNWDDIKKSVLMQVSAKIKADEWRRYFNFNDQVV